MATIRNKRISVEYGDERLEGIIYNAVNNLLEVIILSPQWCKGIMALDFIPDEKPSKERQMEAGREMLKKIYETCLLIRNHADEVKAIEETFNQNHAKLQRICSNTEKAIVLVRNYAEKGLIKSEEEKKAILIPLHRYKLLYEKKRNLFIYRYIFKWFSSEVRIYWLEAALNRICGTNLNNNSTYRESMRL